MVSPMVPSLWTDFVRDLDPEDAIRLMGECGFPAVEFSCNHEKDYLEGSEDEGRRLASIKKAAESAGVRIMQMHGHIFNCCDDNVEDQLAWTHRSVQRAAAMGAPWVVLHPGFAMDMGADPEEMERTRRRNVEVFRALCKTAEEAGVGVAIENLSGRKPRFGSTVSDLLWLMEQLPGKVGVCWDTGHAGVTQLNQGVALRALGKRLVALHIDDNDGNTDQHLTPLRGKLNWQDIMRALWDIGYQGAFNLEVVGEVRITPFSARPAKMRYLVEICKVLLDPVFVNSQPAS